MSPRKRHRPALVFPLVATSLALLAQPEPPAFAQNGGGGSSGGLLGPLRARQRERESESTYLSDFFAYKEKSRQQDILYRFYTSDAKKTRPRLEPFLYGVGLSGNVSPADPVRPQDTFTAFGYGGELFFNNLISGTTGLRTPNFVLGVWGERREEKPWSPAGDVTGVGGLVRLFALNEQDSGLTLGYRRLRRAVFGQPFESWAADVSARVYLMPRFGFEGRYVIPERILRGAPSGLASRDAFMAGGFFEIEMVRFGYQYEKDVFKERKAAPGVAGGPRTTTEVRQMALIGLVF